MVFFNNNVIRQGATLKYHHQNLGFHPEETIQTYPSNAFNKVTTSEKYRHCQVEPLGSDLGFHPGARDRVLSSTAIEVTYVLSPPLFRDPSSRMVTWLHGALLLCSAPLGCSSVTEMYKLWRSISHLGITMFFRRFQFTGKKLFVISQFWTAFNLQKKKKICCTT